MANQTLSIVLEAVNKTKGTFSAVAAEIEQLDKKTQAAGGSMDGFGKRAVGLGLAMGGGIAAAGGLAAGLGVVADQLGKAIGAASDMAETQSKLDVVFQGGAEQLRTWAETADTSMGLSQQAALEAAATIGNFGQALGLSRQEAMTMSPAIVQLAGDLASFNNANPEETLLALRSGLSGETEPMRRFGVAINAATVELKAMEMGLAATKGEITEGDKVMARYALIMDQTKTAQGDFARTGDSLANSSRTLNARMADLSATVGEGVAPAIADAVDKLNKWMEHDDRATKFALELASAMSSLASFTVGAAGAVGQLNEMLGVLGGFSGLLDKIAGISGLKGAIGGAIDIIRNPEGKLWAAPPAGIGEGFGANEFGDLRQDWPQMPKLEPSGKFVLSGRNDIDQADFIKTLDAAFKESAAEAEKAADKVKKAGAAHASGAAAISEAEKLLEDQRRQMASVTLEIDRTLQEEQMRALIEGGEVQLNAVRTSQDAIMEKVRTSAAEFQQRFGVDMPTALQSAFSLVTESTKKLAQETADAAQKQIDAQNRLRDATLGYIQSLASKNTRFAPGVLESIVRGAPGLNDFGGYGVPSFAGGGYMNHDGLAYLHAGERVLTPEQQRGGGLTIIVQGDVYDGERFADKVADAVNKRASYGGPVFVSNAVAP